MAERSVVKHGRECRSGRRKEETCRVLLVQVACRMPFSKAHAWVRHISVKPYLRRHVALSVSVCTVHWQGLMDHLLAWPGYNWVCD